MANEYATVADFKLFTGIGDNDDTVVGYALEAASRHIDTFTGRHFYQDAAGVRTFTPIDWDYLEVDDIYNTTALSLSVDTTNDGTYDTTWTITTDFRLKLASSAPGRPYTAVTIPTSSSRFFPLRDDSVELTANYGWTAVPPEVLQATLIQANRIVHRRNSPEGVAGFSEFGVARISKLLDPDAQVLLDPFRKLLPVIS